jgi:murein DD-endopeptidase MepM/ murein hydrolase activator NlpD
MRKKGKTVWGKESTWDCWQRLADEVQWRAFFVSGTFYFISEDDLFKSQPIAMVDEDSAGITGIDGDVTQGKKNGSVTITCIMGRWQAPPGSVIALRNMGPLNGRWLVNDVHRSLFDKTGTITLKKYLPRLPEPAGSNVDSSGSTSFTWHGAPPPQSDPGSRQWKTETAIIQPVPRTGHPHVVQGIHSTAGLSGQRLSYFPGTWPSSDAVDFGGDAGAPVLAIESGSIVHLSGHDPNLGPADPQMGVHGPFGWSVYLKGDSGSFYYYTHLGTRSAIQGQRVSAGRQIGTIGNYAKYGGVNHTHVGVAPGSKGHPNIQDLLAAPIVGGAGLAV